MNELEKTPAVGVSLQVDLGEGMQMVVQTHHDQHAGDAARARLYDQIIGDVERARSRLRITSIGNEIKGVRQQQALNEPQLIRAEEAFQRTVADIKAKSTESAEADAQKHTGAGRRGEYKMSPQEGQRQVGFARQLKQAEDEREATLKNFAATNAMLNARVAELEQEREKLKAEVNAPYSATNR